MLRRVEPRETRAREREVIVRGRFEIRRSRLPLLFVVKLPLLTLAQ
jgi:hypothetical protein